MRSTNLLNFSYESKLHTHTDTHGHTHGHTRTHTHTHKCLCVCASDLHNIENTSITHLFRSNGVKVVVFKQKLHNISMTIQGCPVEHSVTFAVSAMKQGLHFGGQVVNGVDMATLCC